MMLTPAEVGYLSCPQITTERKDAGPRVQPGILEVQAETRVCNLQRPYPRAAETRPP